MPPDECTLLRRTHAGHEPSARALWNLHAGWMLAYARALLGPRGAAGAEDVVQGVFCRILELDRRTIRQVREVRPWLAQSVRRHALNHIRAARRTHARESRAPAPTSHPAPLIGAPELAAALATLPRRLREVVHLRHVAGLTTDQAALALGLPRGTVASRHHAAMHTLRALLGPGETETLGTPGGPIHAQAI